MTTELKDELVTKEVERDKLFVYGIFLGQAARNSYGMINPRYTTVPGYITVGHGIVQAVKVDEPRIELTGLLVEIHPNQWPRLDRLEAGYQRIKVETGLGQAWMYAEPART